MRRAVRLLVPLLLIAVVPACDGRDRPAEPVAATSTGATSTGLTASCADLVVPPASAVPSSGAAPPVSGSAGGERLPELRLPCYGGGELELARLRGPALVNLWASWCPPCRKELPVLQRFADRVAGRVSVVGVVSEDSQGRAASLAGDLELSFPQLDDPDGRLMRAVGRATLPVTLFVDGAGRVRFVHAAEGLDAAVLDALAERHLGVAAP